MSTELERQCDQDPKFLPRDAFRRWRWSVVLLTALVALVALALLPRAEPAQGAERAFATSYGAVLREFLIACQ